MAVKKLFVNTSFHPTWMNSSSFLQLRNVKPDNLSFFLLKQQLFASTDSLISYCPVSQIVLCWRFIFGWLFSKPIHSVSAQTGISIQRKDGRGKMPSNQSPEQMLDLNHPVQVALLPLDCTQREPSEVSFPGFTLATECASWSQLWKQQSPTRPQPWQ